MSPGVIIYEDNSQLRSSIEKLILLSNDFLLLGGFPNVIRVVEQVMEFRPEIILMDIEMPGGFNGIDAVKKIKALNIKAEIIMLTVFDDSKTVLDAISAGASGYLLKKDISSKLFDAMKVVIAGGSAMSPNIARMVIESMQRKTQTSENKYGLTSREKEILIALSEGTSYKNIAGQYFITHDTVRTHIKNIYQKMQVHKQLEAVSRARNEGIIL